LCLAKIVVHSVVSLCCYVYNIDSLSGRVNNYRLNFYESFSLLKGPKALQRLLPYSVEDDACEDCEERYGHSTEEQVLH